MYCLRFLSSNKIVLGDCVRLLVMIRNLLLLRPSVWLTPNKGRQKRRVSGDRVQAYVGIGGERGGGPPPGTKNYSLPLVTKFIYCHSPPLADFFSGLEKLKIIDAFGAEICFFARKN